MRDIVVFKGNRMGLQLVFDKNADFAAIKGQLEQKLAEATAFFGHGTVVTIHSSLLRAKQYGELINLFEKHGLKLSIVDERAAKSKPIQNEQEKLKTTFPPRHGTHRVINAVRGSSGAVHVPNPLIIRRTLRGGQEIEHSGSIIVFGNVNPGATIIAGGDIDVRGKCRGLVHAGAYGDKTAVIRAERLLSMQIRIAGLISRAPDNYEQSDYPERAFIKDGAIVIEPAESKEASDE